MQATLATQIFFLLNGCSCENFRCLVNLRFAILHHLLDFLNKKLTQNSKNVNTHEKGFLE